MSGAADTAARIASCRWQEAGGGLTAAQRIGLFLDRIGIALRAAPITAPLIVPGIAIDHGALVIDPACTIWPGDLLHEAGHIAVTEPVARATLCAVAADPAEEMAAIAWSWAAARSCDVSPDDLFHGDGYRGGGSYLADNFSAGRFVGVPMLIWYGLCDDAEFPAMKRWLR